MTIKENVQAKIYLSISVFCNRTEWHTLILNGILPYVERTKEAEGYVLSLSRNRGDHIKLFLITSKSKSEELAKKTDKCFGQIFLPNRIRANHSLIPKNGIFRDFEPNTVHYGLYDGHFNSICLQEQLSKLVMCVFQKHGSETIMGLTEIMIEFFALFRDFSGLEKKMVIEIFEKLLKSEYEKYTAKVLAKAQAITKTNYDDNREEIISYLKSRPWQNKILEPHQEQWCTIMNQCQETNMGNSAYLITELCAIFDFDERISAYYLFVNALKQM